MQYPVTIPARYNGPPTSGNGGYSCGALAALIEGPARVRLHVPPPLDTPLTVHTEDGAVRMYDGDTLVGSGEPVDYALDTPVAPSLAEAEDAMSRYVARENHFFETCFVCGPNRPAHDGLALYPGPVRDWSLLACVWRPQADLLDAGGKVRSEVMWAALDCPGYFAAMGDTLRPAVLGELEAQLNGPAVGGDPLVVYCWPLGSEGRKYFGGTAIATADGTVLASSRSTWILLKS
ncbi:MAG: hypothetical protein Hals2KO_11040 [Halioglobus sp.]